MCHPFVSFVRFVERFSEKVLMLRLPGHSPNRDEESALHYAEALADGVGAPVSRRLVGVMLEYYHDNPSNHPTTSRSQQPPCGIGQRMRGLQGVSRHFLAPSPMHAEMRMPT